MRGTGPRPWPRVGTTVAIGALVLALAGCGDDASSDGAAPTSGPTTDASAGAGSPPTNEAPSTITTTTTAPADPDAPRTEVPIEEDLVERLPEFLYYDGLVRGDASFDRRFCDGSEAPTIPLGQARATYDVDDEESLTVAAYRFEPGIAPLYMSRYTEAVQACAIVAAEPRDLGIPDAVGYAYGLETPDGSAFIAMAVKDDVMWVVFQVRVDGEPVQLDGDTVPTFIDAVES